MKKPMNMNVVPSGGWHARFPDGFEVKAQHHSDFLRQCFMHLQANDGDVSGGWQARMWHMLCETHPELPCIDTEAPIQRSVAAEDVWIFLNELLAAKMRGAQAVSEEEQDRRISICLACPRLTHVSCSFGCGKVAEILSNLTLGRKSRKIIEAHKANCGVCACEISSVTAWPIDLIREVDKRVKFDGGEYPSNCWKLEPTLSTE